MAMGTGVVIGAGMAGLVAARVLAERFDTVLVVDRDELPDTAVPRRGAPQGAHPHLVLLAGLQALAELFPGLVEDLKQAGATPFESGQDMLFHRFGLRWPKLPTTMTALSLSRPLLELSVRRRVAELDPVTIRDRVAVSALTGSPGRVTGVQLDDGTSVAADLVVDCSGRGSRSDRWLEVFGFRPPQTSEVKIGVGYATQVLRRSPDDGADGTVLYVLPTPPTQTGCGVAVPIEEDRWLVTLGAWHGGLPDSDADLPAFARALPHPCIADLLDRAEPLGPVARHQFPSSRRRFFERLRAVPDGYVALGDAVASFNPVYGQGITAAILQAQALGVAVDRGRADFGRRYYRLAAKTLATPWQFSVGADFGYPQTTGDRPPAVGLMNRYAARMQRAAVYNLHVRQTFGEVQNLLRPPRALFGPGMTARVLLRGGRKTVPFPGG
jgi:flavin-dependent dehydrogenase